MQSNGETWLASAYKCKLQPLNFYSEVIGYPWWFVKTCVVRYSIHVNPCFSLTPTAIDYREPNISATMQRPHQWYIVSNNTHNLYIHKDNTEKKQVCSVFLWEIATCTGVRVSACNQLVMRRGEVSTLPIQRVGLTPDVPCLQCVYCNLLWPTDEGCCMVAKTFGSL